MTSPQRSTIFALLPLALMLLAFGCANPADDKPAAEVGEATAVPEAIESGSTYMIDVTQSKLGFVGSKVTGSHDGGFNSFEGTIEVVNNDPTASRVMVKIDATSLWSDNDKLTGHLKSPDFFDVENQPEASFESTSIEPAAEGGFTISGNLTLHGVTKGISFPATIEIAESGVRAQAEFFVMRFDFGLEYPGRPDDLIRDEVVIKFDLVGVPGATPGA